MVRSSPTAQMRLVVLAGSLALVVDASLAWPAELQVSRHFYETDKGALHYVMRGDPKKLPPLVLLHSDPRSTLEFQYLALQLPRSQPFVAVDYYGFGSSDDCRCDNATSEYVSFPRYAAEVLKILASNGIQKFIPVGNLKGTNPAVSLAHQAGPDAVEKIVLVSPLILSKSAMEYLLKKFIPSIRNPPLIANGSHLLKAWKDPSGAPCLDESDAYLTTNDEKAVDLLRVRLTRFQIQLAWINHSPNFAADLRAAAQSAQVLVMYSPVIEATYQKYNLDPNASKKEVLEALSGTKYKIESVDGACQGLEMQNATFIAARIMQFVGQVRSGAVVV